MKSLPFIVLLALASAVRGRAADELLDRVDDALTVSSFHDQVRARFSGLLDLEGYVFQQPAPGLIDTLSTKLFNPRLTLFFDAQLGAHFYVFAQARIDRGFDPSDTGAQVRMDEYALRWTPWDDGRLSLQAGKFANVIGNWTARHQSWENPFITAPLLYENITAVEDGSTPFSASDFAAGILDAKYEYNPVIWGPGYGSGVSAAGRLGKFDYAVALTNVAPANRPDVWDVSQRNFAHPSVQARVGVRPSLPWRLGFSAASGPYLRGEAGPTLPHGRGIGDYRETVFGQDVSFEWHHWQVWAEFYETRFEVPRVGGADAFSYYVEAKYKFTPQLFGALRWNQQLFATIRDGTGGRSQWGHDVWRIDASAACRLTAHTQLKLQYSLQHEDSAPRDFSHLLAAQFTLRF